MAEYEFHLIRSLSTTRDLHLIAQFDDGSVKSYDVEKLSRRNKVFKAFTSSPELFAKAKIDAGGYGVIWNEDLDLSSEEIWANGDILDNSFNGLLAFSDASRIWDLNESTLRKALVYGKLKAGIDCCKYGKQWVVTREAMVREYGYPETFTSKTDAFSWDDLAVAEKSPEYGSGQEIEVKD